MKTSIPSLNLADYYYGFLKKLSTKSKIDLIERLVQSLREDGSEAETNDIVSVESFFEAFKSDVTAAEILAEIRAFKNGKSERSGNQDHGAF
ncbi:MAG: hypothetical protein ABIW47_01005 [Ginsengibacter sp.]|jgi:hypothetical protein